MKAIALTGKDACYRKEETGNMVYRYQVVSDIEEYEAAVGDNLRLHTNDKPLFFTTQVHGPEIELYVSKSGKVNVLTSDHDRVVQLIEQNKDTVVGNHIAEQYAKQLLSTALGKTSVPAPAPAPETAPEASADDMNEM